MSDSVDNEAIEALELSPAILRSTDSPGFGITAAGFSPKPFARILAEKLVLARALLGEGADLGSGSVLRKLLEVSSLEDARLWAQLAETYDDMYIASARNQALDRLGEELGLPRPHLAARGSIDLELLDDLPASASSLTIPRGARLLTAGGHHAFLSEPAVFSATNRQQQLAVEAFYPGPSHNLDPNAAVDGTFPQKIDRWHRADSKLAQLNSMEQAAGKELVGISHDTPLTGGERFWSDLRYRQLLLRAPRSIWTVAAVELAVSLIPGVRQVQVQDRYGGLDLQQSIFGNFNFIERLFAAERDLGSPYFFSILVAPTVAAIWSGPDGLRAAIEQALENIRPIGIYPSLRQAEEIGVGVRAKLVVRGLPLPTGSAATVNDSAAAAELRGRLHARLQRYVDSLPFGEPVRVSEMIWAIMSEPGIADVRDVQLVRFPSEPQIPVGSAGVATAPPMPTITELPVGANLELQSDQVPAYVALDAPPRLEII